MIGAHDGRSGKSNPDNEDAFARLAAGVFDFWSAAFAAFAGAPARGGEGPGAGLAGMASPAGALAAFSLLSRLQSVAALSALRYWRSLAQAGGDHQSSLLRLMSAQSPLADLPEDERLTLIEGIGTYLREIGELSSQEARLFQAELEKLGEEFARAAGGPAGPDEYRRRWKYKA